MYTDRSMMSNNRLVGNTGNNNNTSRIMGAPSFIRDGGMNETAFLNPRQGPSQQNKPETLKIEEELDEHPIQVSQGMSEADPNDFGYFTLLKQFDETVQEVEVVKPGKSTFHNVVHKAIKNVGKFSLKKMNLLKSMINPLSFLLQMGWGDIALVI